MMKNTIQFVFTAFLVSLLALMFLYPEQFLLHNRRLILNHDTEIPFENAFTLVSNFFHGGIQLFDRFDQMNYAYSQLTAGMYTVVNLIVAAVYIICSPFLSNSAQGFYDIYAVVFYGLTVLIRTVGGYLLVRKFTAERPVIFLSLIYLNVFLSTQFFNNGLLTNNLYSYFPLLLYFILNFFESFRLKDFLLGFLVFTIALANSPLFALGYFYQAVHCFILICFALSFLPKPAGRPKFWAALRQGGTPHNMQLIAGTGLLGIFIMLPNFYWARSLKNDFFIQNSGMGATQGRLKHAFDLAGYFQLQGKSFINPWDFLLRSIDYEHTLWGESWMFLGMSTLCLALIALVLSRNRHKHVFWATAAFLMLLNFPASRQSPFHWINVLTNPFSFLVRSFHMPTLLVSFLFFPLVALGLQACRALADNDEALIYRRRLPVLVGGLLAFMGWVGLTAPAHIKMYGIFIGLNFLVFLVFRRRYLGLGLLAIVLFTETFALSMYSHDWRDELRIAIPTTFSGLQTQDPLVLEYQNPKILPFRFFYRTDPRLVDPPSYTYQNSFGLYYAQSPVLERYLRPSSLYEPRPAVYKGITFDPEIQQYLNRDGRLMFLADAAIADSPGYLQELTSRGLDRRIAVVDDPAVPPADLTDHSSIALKSGPLAPLTRQFSLPLNDRCAAQRHWVQCRVDLPANFPRYLATGVFTTDYHLMTLHVGPLSLRPVQGKLTQALTFDVQNIKEGKLTLALPRDFNMTGAQALLTLRTPGDIKDVGINTNDVLGLTYEAPHDGWLVIHYPYDPKWQMTIDGKSAPVYKVNRYFIGTPVTAGEHKIVLKYWPDTPLRGLILVSVLLTVMCFFMVHILGFARV